jgi:hypothetical protein
MDLMGAHYRPDAPMGTALAQQASDCGLAHF